MEQYGEYLSSVHKYDYLLTDCCHDIEGSCNVFHAHTILQRVKSHNFFPARWIFYLGHLNKIKHTRKVYKSLPKIICVSEILRNDFVENYDISPDKIIVAYPGFEQKNGGDCKKFRRFTYDRAFVIGLDARGFVSKGGYRLLGALRILRKKHPEMKICARIIYPKYKTNWLLKMYVNLFQLRGSAEFLEFQSDMSEFYNSLDCFLSASRLETFGRVVAEAMYAKIPVIVGSNVGISEILTDGVDGFVFNSNAYAVNNLVRKIEQVYYSYNELEPIIEKAYCLSKRFTWENFAQKLFDGLSSI